jgi:acyl-homoserine lactone synthase
VSVIKELRVVSLVTGVNKGRFERQLDSMFRDRKRVFVDRLKWDIPVVDGVYEKDEFDTDDAVYLIAWDRATGAHVGSMRLKSTAGPHLLRDVFPSLCEGEIPVGEDVWEVTRLCTTPDLKNVDPRNVRRHLSVAMVEFALLYGISRLTLLTHVDYLSRLLAVGWECRPLGMPQEFDGQTLGAMEIGITPTTLKTLRALFGGTRLPVLEVEGIAEAA